MSISTDYRNNSDFYKNNLKELDEKKASELDERNERYKNYIDQEDFFKLLLHQLTNQDPLKPMDDQDMSAQFTRYSQLDEMQKQTEYLKTMASNNDKSLSSADLGYASGLMGKEVYYSKDKVFVTNGKIEEGVDFIFDEEPRDAYARVYDSEGILVYTGAVVASKGVNSFDWDGKDKNGKTLSDGLYRVSIFATGESGRTVEAKTGGKGLVNSVTFDNNTSSFMLSDGTSVKSHEIVGIDNTNNDIKKGLQDLYDAIKEMDSGSDSKSNRMEMLMSGANLLSKSVRYWTDAQQVTGTTANPTLPNVDYVVPSNVGKINLDIYDEDGDQVSSIPLFNFNEGQNRLDNKLVKKADGTKLEPGNYRFVFKGVATDGSESPIYSYKESRVTGTENVGSSWLFSLENDEVVDYSQIFSILS